MKAQYVGVIVVLINLSRQVIAEYYNKANSNWHSIIKVNWIFTVYITRRREVYIFGPHFRRDFT